VWWKCSKGHEWDTTISERTRGTGCPYCSNQSSKPEIRVLTELMYLFDDVVSRYKLSGVEIDAFVPNYNLGFEYDGSYFHKGKEKKDIKKSELLKNKNISLIRIRETPLNKLSENDLVVKNYDINKRDIDKLFLIIKSFVGNEVNKEIDKYIKRKSFVNETLFREYISYFPSPFPEKSLLNEHKELSKEWNYKKNTPLRPENFPSGSNQKVWWKCTKGHEWDAGINDRTHGSGCPYCSGRRVGEDNNLKVKYPEVAKEFHPTKNGDLKPEDFTYGSKKKVWWICSKGHEWDAKILNRIYGQGCPYCSGNRVSEDNNLKVKFPEVAKEFHPTKNGDLKPENFTYGSNKKIWWICSKGHEWDVVISERTRGRGCPYCSGKRVGEDNNLKFKFPKVAKEFHPTKNGDLKPEDFTWGSKKKVWWICSKGHEWDAGINDRTHGSGCPYCYKERRRKSK